MNWIFDRVLPHLFRYVPKRVLYWAVIQAWALATTQKFTDKEPDQVTLSKCAKYLFYDK